MADFTKERKEEETVKDREGGEEGRVSPPPALAKKEIGKPRVISVEKVKVDMAPKGTKPGPKSFKKKHKEWNRPAMEGIDLTTSESEESDGTEGVRGPQLTRSSSKVSVYSCFSDTSEAPSTSSRGRGRPETTGEYRIKKAKMAEKEALERKRKIEEKIEAIINPDYAIAPQKILKVRNEVAEKVEEYRVAPIIDLISRMTEAADLMLKAAIKSTNLKGIIRGELKSAHRVLVAGAMVLASRADKETEEENGAELALLRIELDTAREDIKRRKEKAAGDKRMLEECRKKLERLEDAASPRKRKKRQASPHKKDEEDAMKDMEDVTMTKEGREDSPESVAVAIATGTEQGVALPPRGEWSPVMRFPIQGISKRLEDPVPSPSGKRDLDGLIMERLDSILIK